MCTCYIVAPLKNQDACHCSDSDGTGDLHAALIRREGTRLRAGVESDRLNGEPLLVARRRQQVDALLLELDLVRGEGAGVEPVPAFKARLEALEDGVRARRRGGVPGTAGGGLAAHRRTRGLALLRDSRDGGCAREDRGYCCSCRRWRWCQRRNEGWIYERLTQAKCKGGSEKE
jgi:hypothetical protein